jgi:hypothetical protein
MPIVANAIVAVIVYFIFYFTVSLIHFIPENPIPFHHDIFVFYSILSCSQFLTYLLSLLFFSHEMSYLIQNKTVIYTLHNQILYTAQSFQIQYTAISNTNRHYAIIRNTVRIAYIQDGSRNTVAHRQFQFSLLQSQQNRMQKSFITSTLVMYGIKVAS